MKKKISYLIGSRSSYDYENNLNYIFENEYRCINKVPIDMFFMGILNVLPNATIQEIKDVVIDAKQISGIEVTFKDEDWDNLELIDHPNTNWPKKVLNTNKKYMYEFFD